MTTIVDKIAEASNTIDVITRTLKFKPAESTDFKRSRLLEVMSINENARIADALYAIALRLPSQPALGREHDRGQWALEHPRQWAWINDNRMNNTFAGAMCVSLQQFGTLTPRQQQALDKIVEEIS
jgi:hypothetical protein